MNFERITEQRAYDEIVRATEALRARDFYDSTAKRFLETLQIDYDRATTTGFGLQGEGEYSGAFVTPGGAGYRVITAFLDTLCPEGTEIHDITDSLGELDPDHPRCDIRKPISMAILYYREMNPI